MKKQKDNKNIDNNKKIENSFKIKNLLNIMFRLKYSEHRKQLSKIT